MFSNVSSAVGGVGTGVGDSGYLVFETRLSFDWRYVLDG